MEIFIMCSFQIVGRVALPKLFVFLLRLPVFRDLSLLPEWEVRQGKNIIIKIIKNKYGDIHG